jgi:hypothetical protein
MTEQQSFLVPGGKEKGVSLHEASASTLEYWIDRIGGAIDAGDSRNPQRDTALVHAMRAEMKRRATGNAANAQSGTRSQTRESAPRTQARAAQDSRSAGERSSHVANALAIRERVESLSGSFSTPKEVLRVMREAHDIAFVVTPQTSCGVLPEGCAITSSVVFIDVAHETYGIPYANSEDRGLDKTALAKIAAASGVDWDPQNTRRLDDGSDPFYCHYQAVGRVRNFDGSTRSEIGSVEMDLREGSETFRETEERAIKDKKPNKELQLMRKFILRHAESKAMNRAIRRLGVRTKYQKAELVEKPFVVLRIAFTGKTDDPKLKELYAERIADTFLGAKSALYGQQPQALPSGQHAPPAIDAEQWDDDDDAPAPRQSRGARAPETPPPLSDEDDTDPDADLDHDDDEDEGAEPEDYDRTTGEVVRGRAGSQQSFKT